MMIEQNRAGGLSVVVEPVDDLQAVPASHQGLITPAVRNAFVDPKAYFESIASKSPFPSMTRWLQANVAGDDWRLELHRSYGGSSSAGFRFAAEGIRSARISPAEGSGLGHLPTQLRSFYERLDEVDWMGFGCSGGITKPTGHVPLSNYNFDFENGIDPSKTRAWGTDADGNLLIYTSEGRGGWFNLGSHRTHFLGSVADTIEWLFGELLAGRGPEWLYDAPRW